MESHQSRSTPSKPYVAMNDIKDSMKIFCRGMEADRSENVVAVGPGSLNVHPPMAMYTLRPGSFSLCSIKRWYNLTSSSDAGDTLKVFGLIVAKAKLICVYSPTGIFSGRKTLHGRFDA